MDIIKYFTRNVSIVDIQHIWRTAISKYVWGRQLRFYLSLFTMNKCRLDIEFDRMWNKLTI